MKFSLHKYLYHKSAVCNRSSILRFGLKTQVGFSYQCHWDDRKGLKPLIFLYDKNVLEYDTTYDDDIYQIDTERLDKRRISRDPDKGMKGCYTYSGSIPIAYCSLVYKGTGKDLL
jgi:hypothetical protein